ncbi:YbaK/EbsC family protein [Oscillospiraceae bacterium 38-13]
MSIEKVRAYLRPLGIEDRIREFEISSATVELAAVAVGVEGARIAKSLSFKVEDRPIIIVAAGDAKVDNSKYKARFHTKAKMLTHEEAHTLIGHDVGGVCPFALPEDVGVYLDVSLKRFDTVFPAAGSSSSAIELTCGELERYSSNFVEWVDVCKAWQPEG